MDNKHHNYYYSDKINKLSIEGVYSKYSEHPSNKQIELKNVKVIFTIKKK